MAQRRPPTNLVEVELGTMVWGGTRPIQSNHKHVGYLRFRDRNEVKISPEFTINDQGHARIGHEYKFEFNTRPIPIVRSLRQVDESDIIEVEYDDPFHREGVLSNAEITQFNTSKLWLLGYVIVEDPNYIKIALAKFEYLDGIIDYETPHVLPKTAILRRTYYEPSDRHTHSN